MSVFDDAEHVADALLYGGAVLQPRRPSEPENQLRWPIGVLTPREWSEDDRSEISAQQTEILLDAVDNVVVRLKLRFLQAQARIVEESTGDSAVEFRPVSSLHVGGEDLVAGDEGVAQEIDVVFNLTCLLTVEHSAPFILPPVREVETIENRSGPALGRIVRERWSLRGVLRVAAERCDGPYDVVKLRVQAENVTPWNDGQASRDETVRHSLIAAHTLIAVEGGTFISLLEPPEWARPAVATCQNLNTWPVLVGEGRRDLVLSSPIILYDYPTIAPESQSDLFDAHELDEILTLRTMALTDAGKREPRAGDQPEATTPNRVDTALEEFLDDLR